MSQPPPPPNQPPSGGFGAPQEPSSSHGRPQQPPEPPESSEQQSEQQPQQQPRSDGQQPQQDRQDPLSKTPPPAAPPQQPEQPPQAPPPGYGYPHQQPTLAAGAQPPQVPPSYGYPQQGQPPYGQPPVYGQPPAYGQPPYGQPPAYGQPPYGQPPVYGQPPYGQPPAYGQYPTQPMPEAGGRPGGGKGRIVAIVAAVAAVLLIAGGGVWLLAGGDDDTRAKDDTKGSSEGGTNGGSEGKRNQKSELEVAWKLDPPDISKGEDRIHELPGTWFVGDTVVRALVDSVTAYEMDTGKEAWSIDMARGAKCSAAPTAAENRTVVQWGRKCEKVMGIDLAAGKKLWEKDLPSKDYGPSEFSFTEMAVSGDTAAVSWTGNAVGYNLADGKKLWEMERGAECRDAGYAGGEQLLAHVECGFGEEHTLQSVENGGDKGWEWKAPKGVEIKRVFSVDPVVVGVVAGGGLDITDIMLLDDKGKLKAKIGIPKDRYHFACEGIKLSDCHNVVVDKANNALYLQTDTHQGDGGTVNEIAAFDLTTGKSKWLSEPTREGRTSPLAIEDGKLLGYEQATYDKAGLITSIDPKTGKATPYTRLPEDSRQAERDMVFVGQARPFWNEGGLVLVVTDFYQDTSLNKGSVLVFK